MQIPVARSKIERRLQKLEAVLTDASRAVPHSRKWLLFWTEQMGKYMAGELNRETLAGLIPQEAFRAVFKACDAGEVDSPYARIVRGDDPAIRRRRSMTFGRSQNEGDQSAPAQA